MVKGLSVVLFLLAVTVCVGGDKAEFTEQFKNPPAACRILKINHGWPGSEAGRAAQVESLKKGGFGGFVTSLSFGSGYVTNPANWEAFRAGMEALRQAGLDNWLYDEAGYPSGRAGGLVLKDHPEREARALLGAKSKVVGAGPASIPCPPGKLLFARAYPVGTNGEVTLTGAVELPPASGGNFTWTAPEGRWQLLAVSEDRLFDGSQVDFSGVPEHAPYVNLLDPDTVSAFLDITHERFAKELGNNLGQLFVSTFTDEPSLLASYYMRAMPWSPVAWHPSLAERFAKSTGRKLADEIPWLFLDGAGASRARHDFWQATAEQFRVNYFVRIREWCRAHQIPSGGHLLLEEDIRYHVPLYGDFFACLREMDVPGIDVLSCEPASSPWFTARLASSAAELEGGVLVMSETSDFLEMLAKPPKAVSVGQFRGTINRLLLGGVNRFNTYSTFPRTGWSDADLRALNEWTGRGCLALTGGRRNARIAVLYPVETAWTRFKPSKQGFSEAGPLAERLAQIQYQVNELLYANRHEFSYIDTRTLLEAEIADAELRLSRLAFSVVILPDTDTLPEAAWKKLERFWESGGIVIAAGARPLNTEEEFPSKTAAAIGSRVFGRMTEPAGFWPAFRRLFVETQKTDGCNWGANSKGGLGISLKPEEVKSLPTILEQIVPPDVTVDGTVSPVRMTRRLIDGKDVLFVINDSAEPWSGTLHFGEARAGELLDLATGSVTPLSDPSNVSVALDAWGAVLLRLDGVPLKRLRPKKIHL